MYIAINYYPSIANNNNMKLYKMKMEPNSWPHLFVVLLECYHVAIVYILVVTANSIFFKIAIDELEKLLVYKIVIDGLVKVVIKLFGKA